MNKAIEIRTRTTKTGRRTRFALAHSTMAFPVFDECGCFLQIAERVPAFSVLVEQTHHQHGAWRAGWFLVMQTTDRAAAERVFNRRTK